MSIVISIMYYMNIIIERVSEWLVSFNLNSEWWVSLQIQYQLFNNIPSFEWTKCLCDLKVSIRDHATLFALEVSTSKAKLMFQTLDNKISPLMSSWI